MFCRVGFADDAVMRANNEIGVELGAREQDYREFFNYKGIPGSQLNQKQATSRLSVLS